jgi:type II secretory pathway pseudopilin PulG
LIELLIGLTIISLLLGVGYANYREFARNQTLLGASRQIKGGLRLAQELALAGNKPSPACDGRDLDGYGFRIDKENASYEIEAVCPTDLAWDLAYVCTSHGTNCGLVTSCLWGCYLPPTSGTKAACDNDCLSGSAAIAGLSTVVVQKGNLPKGILIDSAAFNPIVFKVLGEGTNLEADAQITVIQEGTGNIQTITVTPGGEIK